jgi:hypothetical protein
VPVEWPQKAHACDILSGSEVVYACGRCSIGFGVPTKEKFIAGRTLTEIEKILGFHSGRLSGGITVVVLNELPSIQQFDVASYSNIATHRHQVPVGLDIDKIKAEAMKTWATTGFERLVKVLPAVRHDPALKPDIQYPPGHGAPNGWLRLHFAAKLSEW